MSRSDGLCRITIATAAAAIAVAVAVAVAAAVSAVMMTRRLMYICDIGGRATPQCRRIVQTYLSDMCCLLTLHSAKTDSTDLMTGPFLLSISFFCFYFLYYSFLFGSVRQIKLATRQLSGARK